MAQWRNGYTCNVRLCIHSRLLHYRTISGKLFTHLTYVT